MGKTFTALIPAILAACASAPPPTVPQVAPALPPACFNQITVLDPMKAVLGTPPVASPAAKGTPGVIDLQAALKATPEARELRSKGYASDMPEYHVLLNRANERMRSAIRKVCSRRAIDVLMQRGSVVLKPEFTHVAVTDITDEVAQEVAR